MFATVEDVRARWEQAPEDPTVLEALLEDASVWLAVQYKVPPTPSPRLFAVLRMVTCAMVKRALMSQDLEGISQQQFSAGHFSQQTSYRNSEGNLYLTKAERDMLEKAIDAETGRHRGMITIEAVGL